MILITNLLKHVPPIFGILIVHFHEKVTKKRKSEKASQKKGTSYLGAVVGYYATSRDW